MQQFRDCRTAEVRGSGADPGGAIVKYNLLHRSYRSKAVMRHDYQMLLKSSLLNMLAGSALTELVPCTIDES